MANIADGNVSITVRGESLITKFDDALKETTVFDYDWKTIDQNVLADGSVSYNIAFCGRWDCGAAWEFLEDFCSSNLTESTRKNLEFEGTEYEESGEIYNKVYRNADSDWMIKTDDIWEDLDDNEKDDEEEDN